MSVLNQTSKGECNYIKLGMEWESEESQDPGEREDTDSLREFGK